MARPTVGGYPSSGRPASDLAPPPRGPAPGAHPGETEHPTESISSVVGWAASGGLCPHWCKDTRTGPHWHDFVESLEAAGYVVTVTPAHPGSRVKGTNVPLGERVDAVMWPEKADEPGREVGRG